MGNNWVRGSHIPSALIHPLPSQYNMLACFNFLLSSWPTYLLFFVLAACLLSSALLAVEGRPTLSSAESQGAQIHRSSSGVNNRPGRNQVQESGNDLLRQRSLQAFQQLRVSLEAPLISEADRRRGMAALGSEVNHRHRSTAGRRSGRILTLTTANVIARNHTCTGDLFKHKIRMPGCEPKIIVNRFCHGSCSSFYIPQLRSKKLKATFQSCAACVPSETDLVEVRLNCPDREEGELVRKVMRVKKCACKNIELDDGGSDIYDDDYTDAAANRGAGEGDARREEEVSTTIATTLQQQQPEDGEATASQD